jgi:hypothetical protein
MFTYNKENLFAEFDDAKKKDIKLSKKKTLSEKEVDRYDNRIQFFKDHIELKAKHPEYYSDVDVKFDALLKLYQTPSPRDAFYRSIFGMSYAEKMAESQYDKSEREATRDLN